ncbi:hypothetical protein LFL96_26110 [Paraburkholderia sp. D15]|uniref:hypothetical protein n=1 Tax=Paraburkholderia sp. D15 TaxID=2880218 RepID=UPI00247A3DAE|nr:hypothetical protein [Paraburkholderia sp. D15]WGS54486.1 hypothetical protein LFL96_26110 [Paraburkholderia sp. D15]
MWNHPEPQQQKSYDEFFSCIDPKNLSNDMFFVRMLQYFYYDEQGDFFFPLIQSYASPYQKNNIRYLFRIQQAMHALPVLPEDMDKHLKGRTDEQKMGFVSTYHQATEQRSLLIVNASQTHTHTHKFK